MGNPSAEEMAVATGQLRAHAADWHAQVAPLASAGHGASSMSLSGVEMGVFAPLYGVYTHLIQQVAGRCGEGALQFDAIAGTLRAVAGTYDAEEARHVHALVGLY